MSCFKLCCLCLATAATIPTDVSGQQADPFAEDDPVRRRPVRQDSEPLALTFRVLDQVGSPLAGTRIRGPGIFKPLYTDQSGSVVWRTGAVELRRWAARSNGKLRFHAVLPSDAAMPNVSAQVSLATLLETKSIEFRTVDGVRFRGRVIGQRDKKPVAGVGVTIHPNDTSANPQTLSTSTDPQGVWSIVGPRVTTTITLDGYVDGYKLQDASDSQAELTRTVEVPEGVEVIQVPDFEVEQFQPLPVLVTDAEGNPVPAATVRALREKWLDDRIVTWESISRPQQTDDAGSCLLQLSNSHGNVAIVAATADRKRESLEGRTFVGLPNNQAARVVVKPLSKVGGIVLRDGNPVAGVDLLLYEAIESPSGKWTTIGVRGNTASDERGIYVFDAPVGRHYIVATKDRGRLGKQQILHRTIRATTADNYRVPNVDLSAFP